jgi:DNA polymerase-3 subunit epsilon
MLRQNGVDELIERIERDGNYRVLRRLDIREGATGIANDEGETFIGVVVDVETTGLDPMTDVIIEMAMRRFRYDGHGRILKIDRARSWREDPGRALSDEIVRLTGITDADLVGQEIDEDAAEHLLNSADLVIAHNAGFDRKFVERRLPGAAGRAWACSCHEVDWAAAGFDGKALGWLTAQAGFFFDAHRAAHDVDAVIALLGRDTADGVSVLAQLADSALCQTVRVEAVGADFHVKDVLRGRGYRWSGDRRVWCKEVRASDLMNEEFWLASNIYAPEFRPRAIGPRLTELSARERYA